MSVYTELIKVGVAEHEASQIAEGIRVNDNLVTKQDLALAVKDLEKSIKDVEKSITTLEASLAWKLGALVVTTLIAMTAIFSAVVNFSRIFK